MRYLQDYFEFMDGPRLDLDEGRRLPGQLREGIRLENVSFTYPGGDRPALTNLNLTIRPGERIALVGENGAGKTTLIKLLLGLYRPTAGRILVDGVDLNELAPDDWYRRFGTVFQDFVRYETTVRENIVFGWPEGRDDTRALAATVARSGADEVVAALPDSLDTRLGKEFHAGVDLSVGQWQKLAIARAYFRPADILILDEPASALDAKAEAAVYEHFRADGRSEHGAAYLPSARVLPDRRPYSGAAGGCARRAGDTRRVACRRWRVRGAVPAAGGLVSLLGALRWMLICLRAGQRNCTCAVIIPACSRGHCHGCRTWITSKREPVPRSRGSSGMDSQRWWAGIIGASHEAAWVSMASSPYS